MELVDSLSEGLKLKNSSDSDKFLHILLHIKAYIENSVSLTIGLELASKLFAMS